MDEPINNNNLLNSSSSQNTNITNLSNSNIPSKNQVFGSACHIGMPHRRNIPMSGVRGFLGTPHRPCCHPCTRYIRHKMFYPQVPAAFFLFCKNRCCFEGICCLTQQIWWVCHIA